jgi:spore maturation protein SpmA/spore maturation protein SpmB
MVLNYIWIGFFLISFALAVIQLVFFGNQEVFPAILQSTFDSAKTGFEISLALTGVLALWMGLLKIAEESGLVNKIASFLSPFMSPLFPEIPKGHPVFGTMVMNFSANMLGLDNAATPIGLKAMDGLQELNQDKKTASNAQIMFLVLNTSGLTIIPVNVMVYRAVEGAANPADIFLPILIATFFSTMAGLIFIGIRQRINFLNPYLLGGLLFLTALIFTLLFSLSSLDSKTIEMISTQLSSIIIFSIMVIFIAYAWYKKINVYESFIEGAKGGFGVAIKIIPYLIAILLAIGVFRASGGMELITLGLENGLALIGLPNEFAPALPTGLMKPLSGSGARGMMLDTFSAYGVDSFVGKVASTMQGSTETTFYVLAVYFGSVGVSKTRYAVTGGLFADFVGIIAAIVMAYFFFA